LNSRGSFHFFPSTPPWRRLSSPSNGLEESLLVVSTELAPDKPTED
jgi:hypothetical protein